MLPASVRICRGREDESLFPITFAVKAEREHCLRMGQKMLLPWMSERRCRVARLSRAAVACFSRFFLTQARAVAGIE